MQNSHWFVFYFDYLTSQSLQNGRFNYNPFPNIQMTIALPFFNGFLMKLVPKYSDFIWTFYLLIRESFPIQKWSLFSQFCVFLEIFFPKLFENFPKCKVKGSFPKSKIKSLINMLFIYRALSYKTYLSLGLQSHLTKF